MTTTEPAMSDAERSTPAARAGGDVIERAARVLREEHRQVAARCLCGFEPRLDAFRFETHRARVLAEAGLLADPDPFDARGKTHTRELSEAHMEAIRAEEERDRARDTAAAPLVAAQAERNERARLAWWLRAAADGPGCLRADAGFVTALLQLADELDEANVDPDARRWADAPTGTSS